MVKIITGKINSGKTTAIRKFYEENKLGDGIVSKKVMLDNQVFGYYALRLSDNLEFPFMIHENVYKKDIVRNEDIYDTDFIYEIGPYKVYRRAMKKINSIYKEIFKNRNNLVYFDEVGMLEVNEQGYYKNLKKAIKKGFDIVLTTREDLVEKVIEKLKISEYEIISR